jgi:hypothetical protein
MMRRTARIALLLVSPLLLVASSTTAQSSEDYRAMLQLIEQQGRHEVLVIESTVTGNRELRMPINGMTTAMPGTHWICAASYQHAPSIARPVLIVNCDNGAAEVELVATHPCTQPQSASLREAGGSANYIVRAGCAR